MSQTRRDAAEIIRRIVEALRMPASVAGYLRGYADGFDEIGETSNATIKEFLRVLADDRTGTADMISEVKLVKKGVELRLEPLGTHGAVPVMLGSSEFEEKFDRLHAFWYQALLPGQDKEFGWIDLRYDSQIVVRAAAP